MLQWKVWMCQACQSPVIGRATLTGAVPMPGNALNPLNRTHGQIIREAGKSNGKTELSHKRIRGSVLNS